MSFTDLTTRTDNSGNGATKTYAFTFAIEKESDIAVYIGDDVHLTETLLVLNTDYSVDVLAKTITLLDLGQTWLTGGFLKTSWGIAIKRSQALTQESDLRNAGEIRLDAIEDQLDRVVKMCQMLKGIIDGCIKVPESEPPNDTRVRLPARQISGATVIGFADGNLLTLYAVGNTGLGGPVTADYVMLSVPTVTTPNARRLRGTLNQINLVDGGPLLDIVLSIANDVNLGGIINSGRFDTNPISKAQITANQNNYAINGATRIFSDAARDITGLVQGAGQSLYSLAILTNVGAFAITLKNQNAGSTAANRIITGTGADLVLGVDQTVILFYDNTTQRWRVLKNA